jgi:hypothetical protein
LLVVAPMALSLIGAAAPARAWGTREHQEIGTTAYLAACASVERAINQQASADVHERFDIACGPRGQLARLYGDATAIAGDFVGHPSEVLSPKGAWRFSSRRYYYLLALENSEHFNPLSTESWREMHEAAIAEAIRGADAQGLPRVDAWEQAVRENAYADHLLQDSFAAGHMGFNRRGSSAAAAKSFHDYWNAHGRVVHDRAGNVWTAYGDGKLDDPVNADGRRYVFDAATGSVRDLVLTFVLGVRHPELGLETWRALPFTIEAPALLIDAEGLFQGHATSRDSDQIPLAAAVIPARKNTVGHAGLWFAAPFSGDLTVAATANVQLAIPVLPAQASFGAGATIDRPAGGHAAVAEFGLIAPLALSFDGLVSHEAEAAVAVLFGRPIATIVHAEYQGNIELGTALLFGHLGLAEFFPQARTGWYAAFGLGMVFSAAGGGAFSR